MNLIPSFFKLFASSSPTHVSQAENSVEVALRSKALLWIVVDGTPNKMSIYVTPATLENREDDEGREHKRLSIALHRMSKHKTHPSAQRKCFLPLFLSQGRNPN
jgi:hypothetical protein